MRPATALMAATLSRTLSITAASGIMLRSPPVPYLAFDDRGIARVEVVAGGRLLLRNPGLFATWAVHDPAALISPDMYPAFAIEGEGADVGVVTVCQSDATEWFHTARYIWDGVKGRYYSTTGKLEHLVGKTGWLDGTVEHTAFGGTRIIPPFKVGPPFQQR